MNPDNTLPFDLNQSIIFLRMLDGTATTYQFQQIHDTEDQALPPRHLNIDALLPLKRKSKKGYGTFLTVNEIPEGQRRTKDNVSRIRCIIADDDVVRPAPRADWALTPTMVVQSSPGKFHYYWHIAGDIDPLIAEGIKMSIATRYETDWGGVSGPNRVLRLPGFPHLKDPDNPYLVNIRELTDLSYTQDELVAAFGVTELKEALKGDFKGEDAVGIAILGQFVERDALIRQTSTNEYHVICPWHHHHSNDADRRANFLLAGTGGYDHATFYCHHDSCSHRTLNDVSELFNIDTEAVEMNYLDTLMAPVFAHIDTQQHNEVKRQAQVMFRSAHDAYHTQPKFDWLIKGVVERNTMSMIFGDYGTYKSFFMVDMGLHIAAGMDWNGRKTVQGPVFMLIGEGGNGMDRRIQAWCKRHDLVPGVDFPFHYSRIPANLKDPHHMKQMMDVIEEMSDVNPVMIGIDTLHKSMGGMNEDSATDMGAALGEIEKLRIKFGAAMWIVHHTGHTNKTRARGSYALPSGLDNIYLVDRMEGQDTITIICEKLKDGRKPENFSLGAAEFFLGKDDEGDAITSLVLEHDTLSPAEMCAVSMGLKGATAVAFQVLFENGGPMLVADWSAKTQAILEVAEPKVSFSRAKKHLAEKGIIEGENTVTLTSNYAPIPSVTVTVTDTAET